MKISIIIVNYNVKHFLEQCLCSVIKASKEINTEIFVVDNNSTDGSKDFFRGRFDNVRFIWCKENQGFSKANNLALKMAVGHYILFLNPDTIIPEDCLEKCLAYFQLKQEIGAMGIRMIDGRGKFLKESKRGFPSPFVSLCKLSGLTALFPSSPYFARYYLGHLDQYKNHEVDVLAGAFMLVKKSILDKAGGFDERFFMYGEDVDLSYRIQKEGFKNIYFSESTIIHFKGESTRKGSLKYVRLFYGAMILFVKKHYSNGISNFYKVVIQLAIWVKLLFAGMGNWLLQFLANKKETHQLKRCYILADDKEYNFIVSLLQKNNIEPEFIGRINPNDLKKEKLPANYQQLSFLVTQPNAQEIICCINGFTAKQIISLIQQLPTGMRFRFHFAGSLSIVGSSSKESTGDCIAIANPG